HRDEHLAPPPPQRAHRRSGAEHGGQGVQRAGEHQRDQQHHQRGEQRGRGPAVQGDLHQHRADQCGRGISRPGGGRPADPAARADGHGVPGHVRADHEAREASAEEDPDPGMAELVHDRHREPGGAPGGQQHDGERHQHGGRHPPPGGGGGAGQHALHDLVAEGRQVHRPMVTAPPHSGLGARRPALPPGACETVRTRRRPSTALVTGMPEIDPALARWITAPEEDPQNPLLRLSFTLDSPPLAARLLVTGLGTFRAHLNGMPVGEGRLDPGLTDPRRRVQVCGGDVAAQLRRGENVLAIELGRGFHATTTPNVWRWHLAPWRGPVRAWSQLRVDLADGTARALATGTGWVTRPGPVTFDSMYEGETFSPAEDPEAWLLPGYDASSWAPVVVDRPGGGSRRKARRPEPVMQLQVQEPVVEHGALLPRVVSSDPQRIVLDMGRVIAGWCRYELSAAEGRDDPPVEFVARHAEKLRGDGTVADENEHV